MKTMFILLSIFTIALTDLSAQDVSKLSKIDCNPAICCPSNPNCCNLSKTTAKANCKPAQCCPSNSNCCKLSKAKESETKETSTNIDNANLVKTAAVDKKESEPKNCCLSAISCCAKAEN